MEQALGANRREDTKLFLSKRSVRVVPPENCDIVKDQAVGLNRVYSLEGTYGHTHVVGCLSKLLILTPYLAGENDGPH